MYQYVEMKIRRIGLKSPEKGRFFVGTAHEELNPHQSFSNGF